MTGILCAGITNASSASDASVSPESFLEVDKAITVNKALPKQAEERARIIVDIFSDPKVASYNLSGSDIGDNDIAAVFKGLVQREIRSDKELKNNRVQIRLLDISQDNVSRVGVANLLKLLQNGAVVDEGKKENKKIFPDVRGTIMKVSSGVDYTEELLTEWMHFASSVFAGGLRIVE